MIKKIYVRLCTAAAFTVVLLVTGGCSSMVKNPMSYVLAEDETRQDESRKDISQGSLTDESESGSADDSDNASDISDDNGAGDETLTETSDIVVLGTDENTDYSGSGMAGIVSQIADRMAGDSVKGVILIQDSAYADEIAYLLSLTIDDEKPLVIIPRTSEEDDLDSKVASAKDFIYGNTDSVDSGLIINSNSLSRLFDVTDSKGLPSVDIIHDYAGSDGNMLAEAVSVNDGVVVAAASESGSLSSENALVVSGGAGVPVVICSEKAVSENSKITGEGIIYTTMQPVKARILLMLSIERGDSNLAIRETFKSVETTAGL